MAARARFTWNTSAKDVAKRVTGGQPALLAMARLWHGCYRPFVPMRQGGLGGLVEITADDEAGRITHTQPYAQALYNGEKSDFSRDKHPLASAHWDQAAIAAGKGAELAKAVQALLKKG